MQKGIIFGIVILKITIFNAESKYLWTIIFHPE